MAVCLLAVFTDKGLESDRVTVFHTELYGASFVHSTCPLPNEQAGRSRIQRTIEQAMSRQS